MSTEDFSQKEILKMVWEETQKQSHILTTLTSEMKDVRIQTTKTNGRVLSLEERATALERAQDKMGVKVATAVFFVSAVVSAGIVAVSNKIFQ